MPGGHWYKLRASHPAWAGEAWGILSTPGLADFCPTGIKRVVECGSMHEHTHEARCMHVYTRTLLISSPLTTVLSVVWLVNRNF